VIKFLSSFFLVLIVGCGSSSEGVAELNPYNLNTFNPYDDEYFKYQWSLGVPTDSEYVSSNNISTSSHINIYGAWNKTRGSGVKVAVIDTNFNPNHIDLASRVIKTYNVNSNSNNVYIDSTINHGTIVASILAASKNEVGMVGVAPEADLILIGATITDDASKIAAFNYAKDQGAKVICCSWGTYNVSQSVSDVIKEMFDNNITVIFASGNKNESLDNYNDESMLAHVIGVGATNAQNSRAIYSNYGTGLDILAPGGNAITGLVAAKVDSSKPATQLDSRYFFAYGTSEAAPVIAGVVSLLLSKKPSLTPKNIQNILTSTASKIGGNIYDANGFNNKYGYGKVDASKALEKALQY